MFIIEKDGRKREAVLQKCENCGKEFIARKSFVIQGKGRFCCRKCSSEDSKKRIELSCSLCGKTFERAMSKNRSKTGFVFCSRKCKDEAQRVTSKLETFTLPHYDTGKFYYRRVAFREYEHKCACCGYKDDNRLLDVHHLDNDRTNCKPENLIILCVRCHAGVTRGYYNLIVTGHGTARGGRLVCNQDIQVGSNPTCSI